MKPTSRIIRLALIIWGLTIPPMVAFHLLVAAPCRNRLATVHGETRAKERAYDDLIKARSPASRKRARDEIEFLDKKQRAFLLDSTAASKLDLTFASMARENGLEAFSSKA